MTDPKDIDAVLLIIQSEKLVLTKDRKGQVGNQKTRYADLVQVNEVVLARLNQLSTIWVCRPHLDSGVFGLHYQLLHVPSCTEKYGIWPLKLSENPQQLGSATTYGRRYALLSITGVVAEDEDDDGDAGGTERYAQRRAPAAARPQGQATAQRAQRSSGRPALPGEGEGITVPQQKKLHASLNELGLGDREKGLATIGEILGREVTSTRGLSKADAMTVINNLDDRIGASSSAEDWPDTATPPDGDS